MWDIYDTDRNGKLDRKEIRSFIKDLLAYAGKEYRKEVFEEARRDLGFDTRRYID